MPEHAPLRVVVREWARIGITSFGGPPAQVALLRELMVERRRWIDAREFEDANAATQLLPGPGGTQLAVYCARRAGGAAGMMLGGLAFILPGLLLVLAISAVALSESPPLWIRAVGAGGAAAVVAVVVRAGLQLGRSSLRTHHGAARWRAIAYFALGVAATVAIGPGVVLVLVGCGLVELAWRRRPGAAAHSWSPATAVLAATGAAALPALAWTALKVGALSYGGGFVIIPLMQGDAVDAHKWMSGTEFANAVAYGQLTPGPVVHTVAIVGWAAAGLGGALLAAAVAFAPSFAVVALLGDRFVRLRESAAARAFLDGAGPAAVGAILGAAVPLVQALEEGWQWAVLALAALALALGRPALWALVGGALAGLLAALTGAPIP
jgi:chromate transporter